MARTYTFKLPSHQFKYIQFHTLVSWNPSKQPDLHLYYMNQAISCFTDFTQIPLNSYTWVQFNILLTLLNRMKDLVLNMLEKTYY